MSRQLLAALVLLTAPGALAAPAPAPLKFDGETYAFAAREASSARNAEHYLRGGESAERFSRRLTVADHAGTATAKSIALGVVQLARTRTPGFAPDTFAAEGAEAHDLSVAWYDLLDDQSAVEHHVARFVDLPGGGVREYHFVLRRYTNGAEPDAAFMALRGTTERRTVGWVELLTRLDRAPLPAPPAKKVGG